GALGRGTGGAAPAIAPACSRDGRAAAARPGWAAVDNHDRPRDELRAHARQSPAALRPPGPGTRALRTARPRLQLTGGAPIRLARPERPPLFRREALEFQASQPQGGVLRIDPPWTRWAYWI